MRKRVLLLAVTGMSCLAAQGQTKALPTEVPQVQKRAMAQTEAAQHSPITEVWVDQRQQLDRTLVANAIAERQIALRRDTEKLLTLAAELKQNVDKTSPNILSLDVIKKAQEIEKLAKSVKDKMKDAY